MEGDFMAQPFCAKWYEELIFQFVGKEAMQNKNTRAYLKKMSKHLAAAFRMGKQDGKEGKPIVIPPVPGRPQSF